MYPSRPFARTGTWLAVRTRAHQPARARLRLEQLEDRIAPADLYFTGTLIECFTDTGASAHITFSVYVNGPGNSYLFSNGDGPLTVHGNPNGSWIQNDASLVSGTDTGMGPQEVVFFFRGDHDSLSVPEFQTNSPGPGGALLDIQSNADFGSLNVTLGSTGALGGTDFNTPMIVSGLGPTSLTLNDSADSTGRNVTITNGQVTGLAATTISYSALTTLNILGGSGNDNVTVPSTACPVLLNGGGGIDTVALGSGTAGVQAIPAPIAIANPGGQTYLSVNDAADSVAQNSVNINSDSITGLAPATISFAPGDLAALIVNGPNADSSFYVNGTPSSSVRLVATTLYLGPHDAVFVHGTSGAGGAHLDIVNGSGNDNVTIGDNSSTVAGIEGAVVVGGTGPVNMQVLDNGEAAAHNVTLSDSAITGLAPAPIEYEQGALGRLFVQGSTGGNTFTIANTPSNVSTPLATTLVDLASDQVFIQNTSGRDGATLALQADGTNDALAVALGNPFTGVQGIAGAVSIQGNNNVLALSVDDSADTKSRTATLGTASISNLAPTAINFTGTVAALAVKGGSGGNSFTVANTLPGIMTALATGTGSDIVTVDAVAANSTLAIDTQDGADAVVIGTAAAGGLQSIMGRVALAQSVSGPRTATVALTLNDVVGSKNLAIHDRFTITASSVTGSVEGPPFGGVDFPGVANLSININATSQPDDFAVAGAPVGANILLTGAAQSPNSVLVESLAGGALTINGNGGPTTVTLGGASGAGNLQGIHGSLTLENTGASTTLDLNDSADPVGQAYVMYKQVINVPSTNLIVASYTANLAALSIEGGAGGNVFQVNDLPAPTTLAAGAGNDLVTVVGATAALTIDGQRGVNNVSLGNNGSLAGLTAPVTVSTTNFGSTALTVDDSADSTGRAIAVTSTAITGLPLAGLRYSKRTQVNVLLGSGTNRVDVSNFLGNGSLTGSGADTLVATASANFTLTDTSLTRSGIGGSAALDLSGFSNAILTATAPGTHTINTTGFSGTATVTNPTAGPAACSVAGGSMQSTIVGTAFAALLQASVTDAAGNPVAGVPVLFAVPTAGPGGSFNALPLVLTDARGIATAPRLTANHSRGSFTVTATALGVAGSAAFLLTNLAVPAAVTIVSGNNQHAIANSAFASPLAVKVSDAYGQAIAGIAVDFAVASTSGAGAAFGGTSVVTTNTGGVATAPALVANTAAGSFVAEAWVAGVTAPVKFTLANTAGPATSITTGGGTPQSAAVGKAYATALQALVVDSYGNPVPGAVVTFTVVPNGGAGALFAGKGTVTATTNGSGLALAPALTANSTVGSFTVTAGVAGAGTPASFALANTVAPAKIRIAAGTPQATGVNQTFASDLAVLVLDANGNPISGVVVTFTVRPAVSNAGGSFNGPLAATATTTNLGIATAPLIKANSTAGKFTVVATVAGLSTQLTFDLTCV